MKRFRRILAAFAALILLIPVLATGEQMSLCAICGHGAAYQEEITESGGCEAVGDKHEYVTVYYNRCTLCGNKEKLYELRSSVAHGYGDWRTFVLYEKRNSTQHYQKYCKARYCLMCNHEDLVVVSVSSISHHSNGWPIDEECYGGYHRFYKSCDDCGEKYLFRSEACDGSNHPTIHRLPEEREEE